MHNKYVAKVSPFYEGVPEETKNRRTIPNVIMVVCDKSIDNNILNGEI